MSRSSFLKAYEEITNFESKEMTFTINDADLDKLNEILKDINVKECPWFEVQDKHGNKARYYREPQWIPVDLRNNSPEENKNVLLGIRFRDYFKYFVTSRQDYNYWTGLGREIKGELRWQPLPSPYQPEEKSE